MLCASCFSAANALCADDRLLELRALARLLKSVLCCCSVLFLLSEEVPCAALLLKIPADCHAQAPPLSHLRFSSVHRPCHVNRMRIEMPNLLRMPKICDTRLDSRREYLNG